MIISMYQQKLIQVVSSLLSLKGGLKFVYRMQKLMGDSLTIAKCTNQVEFKGNRAKLR